MSVPDMAPHIDFARALHKTEWVPAGEGWLQALPSTTKLFFGMFPIDSIQDY